MAKTANPDPDEWTNEEIDVAICHICFALGAGAEHHWISAEAIKAVRRRFRGPFKGFPKSLWEDNKAFLLRYFEAIGRIAATESVSEGRHDITKEDIVKAIDRFEDVYKDRFETGQFMGLLCPDKKPY